MSQRRHLIDMKQTAQIIKNRKQKTILRRVLFVWVSFLALSVLSFPFIAHAQQASRSITIVPPSIETPVNPGDKKEGILKVINNGDIPLTLTASTQDFIVKDFVGTPDFLPQDTLKSPYSAASWIGIVPDTFTVNPHQTIQLHYYLQIPKNARPGGHYAGVIYTPTESLSGKGTGAAVQTEIGTLFALDIAGPVHEQAQVTQFYSNKFQEYGPVYIHTQILNLGDLHIKPIGSIRITDMLGRQIGVIPLDEHNIFPQAARDYLNIFGQHWMLGPFHAKLILSYGRNDNLPLLAEATFWVFPWKMAVVLLLIIVVAVMGYFVWKRRRQNQVPPPHEQPTKHSEA